MQDMNPSPNPGHEEDPTDANSDDEDSGSYDNAADDAEVEHELEIPRPSAPSVLDSEHDNEEHENAETIPENSNASPVSQVIHGERLSPHIVQYGRGAGHPVSSEAAAQEVYAAEVDEKNRSQNTYAPFSSRLEWEIARWAKFQANLSASAVTELLSIDGVRSSCSFTG